VVEKLFSSKINGFHKGIDHKIAITIRKFSKTD